jgi:Flp pilus assembly protein TadD
MKSDDKDILFVLGVLYLEGGSHTDNAKARDTFKKLTEVDPNDGPAWINYGVAMTRLGNTQDGVAAIKKGKALGEK